MNITLHQLKVLKAVKECGSITKAAQTLHITQPAVSNILKQLELNFDCPLTETIGKKVFITQAGQHLTTATEKINDILETTNNEIYALNGKLSGTMIVAIVSTAKYFMPKLLGQFQKKYPDIKIKLNVCNRQEAIELLQKNACDFLIMSQLPQGISLEKKLFYKDELVVAGAKDHPVLKKNIELKDLENENWIIREPGSGTRIVMQNLFKKHKMTPNITMEVGNNESIKQIIIAGLGISIVSKQSIELELKHNLIKIISVKNFPLPHPWHIVMNKGKHIDRVTNEFFEFIKKSKSCHLI
ncbi:MAG: LysR family transcriptional regulator [Gammaproteobacteria bacterium]